jgi:peptidoglycan/xylan/chitin deacetylase (PgdA/CDA1 family)
MTSALVLTFHGLTTVHHHQQSKLPFDAAARHYLVDQGFFAQTVAEVASQQSCTASQLFQKKSGDWTIITFDDGLFSDFVIAYPLLREKGLVATFFVTYSKIGANGYCSKQQLREMSDHGMEIGSHGLTHSYLVNMRRSQARNEIFESKERIEQIIGKPVFSFAAVGGHFEKWVLNDCREAGYRCFASMVPGVTEIDQSSYVLMRNHLQACHDMDYLKRLLAREQSLLFKNLLRYWILFLAKRVLGLQRYDRWKSRLMETNA